MSPMIYQNNYVAATENCHSYLLTIYSIKFKNFLEQIDEANNTDCF